MQLTELEVLREESSPLGSSYMGLVYPSINERALQS